MGRCLTFLRQEKTLPSWINAYETARFEENRYVQNIFRRQKSIIGLFFLQEKNTVPIFTHGTGSFSNADRMETKAKLKAPAAEGGPAGREKISSVNFACLGLLEQ